MRKFLDEQKASARNLMPAIMEPSDMVQALDKDWNGGVPYSMVIAPGGKVLYRGTGRLDIIKTRRLILGVFPTTTTSGRTLIGTASSSRTFSFQRRVTVLLIADS